MMISVMQACVRICGHVCGGRERVFVHVCKRASVRVRRVAHECLRLCVCVCVRMWHVRVRTCMHVEVPGRAQADYLLIKVQGRLTP